MARILVTGAQSPAQHTVVRALAQRGHDVFAAITDATRRAVPGSRPVLMPASGTHDFAPAVLHAAHELDVSLVLPTGEADLVALARGARIFAEDGIALAAAEPRVLGPILDKAVLALRCRALDLAPRTVLLDEAWRYRGERPVLARSRRGAGEIRIDNPTALAGLPRDGSWIVQEILLGSRLEVDVLAHPDSGQPLAAVTSQHTPAGAVRVEQADLERRAVALVESLRLEWVTGVSFQRDIDGRPRVVGLRAHLGTTAAIAAEAGLLDWVVARGTGGLPPRLATVQAPLEVPPPRLALAS